MKLLLLILLSLTQAQGATTTLKDAFMSARAHMETLQRADAFISQKEERKSIVRSAMLPNINGVGNYTRIDPPSASGVSRAFTLTKQYSAGIRLQQPLIRGGTIAAYQLAKEDILLAEFQKDSSELNLYQLVISAYYNLYLSRLDNEILKELLKFSHDRVNELKSRAKVGRSRRGELVQAEAQYLAAQSQFQTGAMNMQQAEKNFEYYTQMEPQELAPLSIIPRSLPSLEDYLQKMRTRPDMQVLQQQVKIAEKQVGISKGAHYPSLDLVSNYYFDRTGVLQTSNWDAALVVNVPLFQGGGTQAAVRESVEKKRVAELDSRQGIRTAERDLMVLYQNYLQTMSQLDTLQSAVKKAEEGYHLNLKDYQFGQVTNLDVLSSLNLFIETKRAYNTLTTSAHLIYNNLEASTGVLP